MRGFVACHLRRLLLGMPLLFLFLPSPAPAARWALIGPEGGDARSLAGDPRHPERIFLGTSSGQLFLSQDQGATWTRVAHLGEGDDHVLDNMEIDPRSGTMYVGAWSSRPGQASGDLYRSQDEGKTWTALPGMRGKSIRALTLAPSDPSTVIVGALDGVHRSRDGGNTWQRISSSGGLQLRNVESVAIDPHDPNVIYAGTWHLGWKTTDGGRSWRPMKNGILDDSDVFSIIIDRSDSRIIYLSACSGIYKSEYSAELFHKVNGMPYSARRTLILKQDPDNSLVVYAGTTEGLWRTEDGGRSWRRLTANLIVNDVFIDPQNSSRIMLATNRSGVLLSTNSGASFAPSNHGFSHRAVSALLLDNDARTIYAGVLNDKEFGGVFLSHDRGQSWRQLNRGIENLDVFTLAQTTNGDILAGTNQGIFKLPSGTEEWQAADAVFLPATKPDIPAGKAALLPPWSKGRLRTRIMQLHVTPGTWFAATSRGLYRSRDEGRSWEGGAVLGYENFRTVQVSRPMVLATTPKAALLSSDGGWNWSRLQLPGYVTNVYGGSLGPDRSLWLSTHEGALRSTDWGATWEQVAPHLLRHVTTILCDKEPGRLLVVARAGRLFSSQDGGRTWKIEHTGFALRGVATARGVIFAATTFDGVIAETPPTDAQVAASQK